MQVLIIVFVLAYVVFASLIASLSIWLLLNAKTAIGVNLALTGVCFSILPAVFGLWKWDHKRRLVWKIVIIGLSFAIVLCLVVIFVNIPTGQPTTLRVSHQFTKTTSLTGML